MTRNDFAAIFSYNLRSRRLEQGLTQKQLGELIGYSEKSVSKWESGDVIAPSNILPRLSDILHTSIDALLREPECPEYFLGVDGGGTKCEFLLCDGEGRTVARTVLGACNPVDIGIDAALAVLKEGIDTVCAGISPCLISAFIGVAGGISGDYKDRISAFLEKFRFARYDNGSDAQNAVAAALGDRDGIAVIAGTGSIAFVKRGDALTRIGGHGYLIDEGGNGFSIGQAGIRAALLCEEGSLDKDTLLLPLVKEKCGKSTVLDAIADFYSGGKREIASYAAPVFDAAEKGDCVAKEIIADNARCIARLIEAAGKKTEGDRVTTALVGGLTSRADMLLPLIKDNLKDKARYDITVFSGAPVTGALLLAGLGGKQYA